MSVTEQLATRLAEVQKSARWRRRRVRESPPGAMIQLDGRELLSFASNDYLGLADDPRLIEAAAHAARRWGVGAGASHNLGGHSRAHAELERALAAFVGAEDALLFSTGYLANLGLITALAGRHDVVFAERRNHASLIDAVKLSGARHRRYRDQLALRRLLAEETGAGQRLIVSDAVFSMDGDIAPLTELAELAESYDAWLLIDDAHGFGMLGEHGRGALAAVGLAPRGRILLMATLGKATGVAGAFVAGDRTAIEWLRQQARPAIYTTAQPPLLAETTLAALVLLAEADERRNHLQRLIGRLRRALTPVAQRAGWSFPASPTPIQPLIIGQIDQAQAVSEALLDRGIWAPAIRPPTVPPGTARLRISLSAAHREEDIERLIAVLTGLTFTAAAP